MLAKFPRQRLFPQTLICVLALFAAQIFLSGGHAQSKGITLISQETSTRAIAVDSVTQKREPFNPISTVLWGNDSRTRLMVFAMGLATNTTAEALTAQAEDGSHKTYSLVVEYVGKVPDQEWASAIIVCLPADISDVGDVLIGIS